MKYQQLANLLTLFSPEGIFYNFSTKNLLADPVFIPEHPVPELRSKIFSRAHLEHRFSEVETNITRLTELQRNIEQARNHSTPSSRLERYNAFEVNRDIIEAWVTEISILERILLVSNHENSPCRLKAGETTCPISRQVIKREQLVPARNFMLICALLVQRVLNKLIESSPPIVSISNSNICSVTETVQQGYELLCEFITSAATNEHFKQNDMEKINAIVNRLLYFQPIAADELHPQLQQYLCSLVSQFTETDLELIQQGKYITIEPEICQSLLDENAIIKHDSSFSIEQEVTLGEDIASLNSLDNLDNYKATVNNTFAKISPPQTANALLAPANLALNLINIESNELTPTLRLRTENIKNIETYSGLQIPSAPVVLPYNPIQRLDYINSSDEIVNFPLTIKFNLHSQAELPPAVKCYLDKLNINIFQKNYDINFFISVQSIPKNWQNNNAKLFLRPHSWLHANASIKYTTENNPNVSSCLAAIATTNSSFMQGALVDGLCIHKINKDELVFSAKQLQIEKLDYDITNNFYSVCLEYDYKTSSFTRAAITLHCLLNDTDALVLNTITTSCNAQTPITIEKFIYALTEYHNVSQHNIPTAEFAAFISANWPARNLQMQTQHYLLEQQVPANNELIPAHIVNALVENKESSINELSPGQSSLIAAVMAMYQQKFTEMGGVEAVLDDFKSYLKSKIVADNPTLPLQITHENIAYINNSLGSKLPIADTIKEINAIISILQIKELSNEDITRLEKKLSALNDELNYIYVKYIQTYEPKIFASYLSPYHTTLRYLASRNYFMHPNAKFVIYESTNSSSQYTLKKRGYRAELTDEAREAIAYFWLASSDKDAEITEPGYNLEARKEFFVEGMHNLARAHNFDEPNDLAIAIHPNEPEIINLEMLFEQPVEQNSVVQNSVVQNPVGQSKEKMGQDNGGLDRPTCCMGVRSRLTLALFAHPLLERKYNLLREAGLRFVEFVAEQFSSYLATYYDAAMLKQIYRAAYYCWTNAELLEEDDSWEGVAAWFGDESTNIHLVKKFVSEFQTLMKLSVKTFFLELNKKYGETLKNQPQATEIKQCIEFGMPKFNIAQIRFSSYEQFIRFIINMFWINYNENKQGVYLNKAMAGYLDARLTGLVNSRVKQLQELNAPDILGQTKLHHACQHGDIDKIAKLLAAGCDLNARDMQGYKPLDFVLAPPLIASEVTKIKDLFVKEEASRTLAFHRMIDTIQQKYSYTNIASNYWDINSQPIYCDITYLLTTMRQSSRAQHSRITFMPPTPLTEFALPPSWQYRTTDESIIESPTSLPQEWRSPLIYYQSRN